MLSLLAGIADRLSRRGSNQAYRNEIIGKAMAFKMRHIVDRFRHQEEVSEFQALELERELKRYLAMCALHPRITFPMDGLVDKLWHVFLAHTADYRRFCDGVAGRMIDHWPAGGANGRSVRPADHATFIRIYKDLFGVLPAAHIWPFMEDLRDRQRRGSDHSAASADGCSGSAHHHFRDGGGDNAGTSGCGGGGGD